MTYLMIFMHFFWFSFYKSICCGYSVELHWQVDAIEMSTYNICLYKEVDKKYTGHNLKTMELLDCALIGVCVVIRLNMVFRLITVSPDFSKLDLFYKEDNLVLRSCTLSPLWKGASEKGSTLKKKKNKKKMNLLPVDLFSKGRQITILTELFVSLVSISIHFNSSPASGAFCCLLITFANSLNPDQAGQNIRPDLDPNCLLFCDGIPERFFLIKLI